MYIALIYAPSVGYSVSMSTGFAHLNQSIRTAITFFGFEASRNIDARKNTRLDMAQLNKYFDIKRLLAHWRLFFGTETTLELISIYVMKDIHYFNTND